MQLKKDDLTHLINTLSPAEKKTLTLYLSTLPTGKVANYIDLFRDLQREKELDTFKQFGSLQAQAKAKKRLYDNILKGIRNHHDKKSVDIIIQNILSEIEILHDLGLPEQARYMLHKGYLLAHKFEKHGLLLQILGWEGKLNIVLDQPTRSMERIIAEEQEVLSKLSQIMLLKSIYNKFKELKRYYGYSRGNIKSNLEKETIHAPNMVRYKECTSQKARFYHNFIYTIYFWMADKYLETYKFSKELVSPEMQIIGANDYINGIMEHVLACVNTLKFESAFTTLTLAEKFMQNQGLHRFHALNIKLAYCEINSRLIIHNYIGRPELLKQSILRAKENLDLYKEKFSLEMKQVTLGNLMNAYLGIGDFEQMDEIWNKIFLMKPLRNDIKGDLYSFKLFSILQSEIYQVLPSAALSAHRFYSQSPEIKKRFELELKITTLLIKEHDFEDLNLKQQILKQLRSIFENYVNTRQNNYPFHEHYSRYIIWISSMINNRSFHKEAALWYQQLTSGCNHSPIPSCSSREAT